MLNPQQMRAQLKPEKRFSQAPPGYSLTSEPGKWAWEQPPEFTTPSETVDALIGSLQDPEAEEQMVQLMAAGISIEELVNVMTKVGFMEGKFSADVAEIIKVPLSFYFMGLAVEAGIDNVTKVFNTKDGLPRTNYGLDDATLLTIMQDRNPRLAQELMVNTPKRIKGERAQQARMAEESFLAVPEPTMQGRMLEAETALAQEPMEEEGEQ